MQIERIAGDGWLALLGGGEFSFGETEDADAAWLAKAPAGVVGFVPAASGSTDYGTHFAEYLAANFDREVETVPIYRPRDARRGKNAERLGGCAAVYVGGGVTDHLLEALAERLRGGGTVVAIAAAAQAFGRVARSLLTRQVVPGLAWLPQAVVEPNFEPEHDRRLRQMMASPGVELGIGLPAGCALLLGPGGEVEALGPYYTLTDADGDLEEHAEPEPDAAVS